MWYGEVPRVNHTDDLDPVAILHCLQRRLDMAILIRQRAKAMRVQKGVRDSHPLVSHLVIRVFKCMQYINGVVVRENRGVMKLVI